MTGIDAMLFGLAGRVDWRAAWVLSVLLAAYIAAGMMWFLRKDPDLLTTCPLSPGFNPRDLVIYRSASRGLLIALYKQTTTSLPR